ncbi:MAG: putative bifunctional diguanylate cyclase/phosphodiesterase, partial [Gammaproteobacteria bacterium]
MSAVHAPRLSYSLLLREIDNLAAAPGVRSLGMILIGLTGLRAVNDGHGYAVGDQLLEDFGRRLTGIARPQDKVIQVNGTTFVLLIRNPAHKGHVVLAAERIIRETRVAVDLPVGSLRLSAHLGIALMPESATDADSLLRQCELAAKESQERKQSYTVYENELGATRGDSCEHLAFDLDEVLKRNELELYYQPKIELRTGRIAGAEALVRWNSPTEGLVSPSAFLPAVEGSRGIHALFAFTLKAALRCTHDWSKRIPGFKMAVNMSPGNLEDPDLLQAISDSLGVWALEPDQLVLEITETALMRDAHTSALKLEDLHALGVHLAIDDFGSGHAGLAYLRNLPADELKIDQSFISPVLSSERDRRIVGSVIQLAHAVNMGVVAEGIENAEVMQVLQSMDCDIGQGFHFGAAIPADQFEAQWV